METGNAYQDRTGSSGDCSSPARADVYVDEQFCWKQPGDLKVTPGSIRFNRRVRAPCASTGKSGFQGFMFRCFPRFPQYHRVFVLEPFLKWAGAFSHWVDLGCGKAEATKTIHIRERSSI